MLLNRKRMGALAAALGLAGVSLAGNSPGPQSASSLRAVNFAAEELPPAPMPEPQGAAPGQPVAAPPAPGLPSATPPPAASLPSPEVVAPPMIGGPATYAGMNRWGVMPPPGTLGRTYQRRSTLISDDEHPRTAAVAVHLPEQANVSARGLKVKWTGEEWLLQTAQPLVPGVPHIYAIRAEWETPTGTVEQTRWVRLIMGRVVDLEF